MLQFYVFRMEHFNKVRNFLKKGTVIILGSLEIDNILFMCDINFFLQHGQDYLNFIGYMLLCSISSLLFCELLLSNVYIHSLIDNLK